MAAPRVRCAHCGEPFDRRANNVTYCKAPACRLARNRENIRSYRLTRAVLDDVAVRKWAEARQVAA